jgi:hypothetical protein
MSSTESVLASSFSRATSHCRRDHLWNRLHNPSNALTFPELVELLTLTRIEEMNFPDLSSRGTAWFVKLVKVLSVKYESHYRKFVSGESEHHVLLRENNVDVCTLVSIDSRRRLPSIFVVFREIGANDEEKAIVLTHQVHFNS